jgi:sarcosine oxidase subunit beta
VSTQATPQQAAPSGSSIDETFDVVIIGAGIMGLSIAYQLGRLGQTRVAVVDRGYLCGGASGRNGGGIRAQWSSETNVRLMQESLRMCRDFASEMRINVWFREGGYLFLVRSEDKRRSLEESVKVQNACGLGTRMLTPAEAQEVVPELDTNGVVAASYNPKDAVVFPWPFVWGFAQGAKKLGASIMPFTDVVGLDTRGSTLTGVRVRAAGPRGVTGILRTRKVINAAGAWSPEIAKLVGVELPNKPHRHEICSSEPLKPWLRPLVADLTDGLYFSQSTRGEIVGGIGQEHVPAGINQDSSFAFLGRYAKALTRACPVLGEVKILRQWAGCYDLTPDANPVVGAVDEIEHFYQASGFMGHGFMMAPIMGKAMAEHVHLGTSTPLFDRWNLRRFKQGKLLSEAMIIG